MTRPTENQLAEALERVIAIAGMDACLVMPDVQVIRVSTIRAALSAYRSAQQAEAGAAGGVPTPKLLQFAVFDEFGESADDRVQDYAREWFIHGRQQGMEQARALREPMDRDVAAACSELRDALGNPVISGAGEQTLHGQIIRAATARLSQPAASSAQEPDAGKRWDMARECGRLFYDYAKLRAGEDNPFPLNREQALSNASEAFGEALAKLAGLQQSPGWLAATTARLAGAAQGEADEVKSLRDRIIEGELVLDGTHPPTLLFLMAEHWKAVATEYRAKAKDYDRLAHELRLSRVHPQAQVERKPLDGWWIRELWVEHGSEGDDAEGFARAIELAHGIRPTASAASDEGEPTCCQADRDGDCTHKSCPQLRDGEPRRSGRHCPLDRSEDDDA